MNSVKVFEPLQRHTTDPYTNKTRLYRLLPSSLRQQIIAACEYTSAHASTTQSANREHFALIALVFLVLLLSACLGALTKSQKPDPSSALREMKTYIETTDETSNAPPSIETSTFTDTSKEPIQPETTSGELADISYSDSGTIDQLDEESANASSIYELNRKRSQVKFIAGLIAQARPSLTNCAAIARHIVEISSEKSINPFYVAAIISIESSFSPTAKSHVGATGLMQLMPTTAHDVSEQGPRIRPKLTDPQINIRLGIDYLQYLDNQYEGNKTLALAAYNWGPTNVAKVNNNTRRFPRSVKKYAKTIIERTEQWQRHYIEAHTAADQISNIG